MTGFARLRADDYGLANPLFEGSDFTCDGRVEGADYGCNVVPLAELASTDVE